MQGQGQQCAHGAEGPGVDEAKVKTARARISLLQKTPAKPCCARWI